MIRCRKSTCVLASLLGALGCGIATDESAYDYLAELEEYLEASIVRRHDVALEDLRALSMLCDYIESADGEHGDCTSTDERWVGVSELFEQVNFGRFNELADQFPVLDPWGREYLYSSDGVVHAFASYGRNGKAEADYSVSMDRQDRCKGHRNLDGDFVVLGPRDCVFLFKETIRYQDSLDSYFP